MLRDKWSCLHSSTLSLVTWSTTVNLLRDETCSRLQSCAYLGRLNKEATNQNRLLLLQICSARPAGGDRELSDEQFGAWGFTVG